MLWTKQDWYDTGPSVNQIRKDVVELSHTQRSRFENDNLEYPCFSGGNTTFYGREDSEIEMFSFLGAVLCSLEERTRRDYVGIMIQRSEREVDKQNQKFLGALREREQVARSSIRVIMCVMYRFEYI